MSEEQSVDLTPGVVWTDAQLAVVRDLTARAVKAQAAVERVQAMHAPFGIYDECGHDHKDGEAGVEYIDEVGLVCESGLMYRVCHHCCVIGGFGGGQTEECVTNHGHGKDEPICPTRAAITGATP